jgi:tetratricopeptide (TPR) repeat protein
MLTQTSQRFFSSIFSLLIAGLLFLQSCTPVLPPADPERAVRLRQEAFKFEFKKDFAAAIIPYEEATRYAPHDSSTYLKLAELQEAIQKPQDAYDTYETALRYLSATDPERERIQYRAALLLAEKLGKPGKAQKQIKQLNQTVYKSDLAGVVALHQNQPRKALKEFQITTKQNMTENQSARVYFHVAQAYDRLGDEDLSRQALLVAVEKASSRDLKEDIKRFFEAMLAR